jgi:hypothetical protein
MGALLQVLWLALPVVGAGVLHMAVVKRDALRFLAVPIDRGARLRGVPVLGPNKTWRGVVVMVAASAAGGAVQGALGGGWAHRGGLECFDVAATSAGGSAAGYAAVSAVLGLGYVLGELPNSFAKRRLGIDAGLRGRGALGRLFAGVDQVDSVLVGLGLGAVVFGYPWRVVLVGTVTLAMVHLGATALLHRTGVKENP